MAVHGSVFLEIQNFQVHARKQTDTLTHTHTYIHTHTHTHTPARTHTGTRTRDTHTHTQFTQHNTLAWVHASKLFNVFAENVFSYVLREHMRHTLTVFTNFSCWKCVLLCVLWCVERTHERHADHSNSKLVHAHTQAHASSSGCVYVCVCVYRGGGTCLCVYVYIKGEGRVKHMYVCIKGVYVCIKGEGRVRLKFTNCQWTCQVIRV